MENVSVKPLKIKIIFFIVKGLQQGFTLFTAGGAQSGACEPKVAPQAMSSGPSGDLRLYKNCIVQKVNLFQP